MHSPWLEIPLADYEGHMSLPSVGQARMLADQLAQLVAQHAPASVAVVGCAGGNGLDRCDSMSVIRVVAIDINPRYIAACRIRYANRLDNLELHCADVASKQLQFEPVDLIYAAMIFEYADIAATLATCRRNLRPGGALAALLQLSHSEQPTVSPSPYSSLRTLADAFTPVEPADLRAHAAAAGFEFAGSNTIVLPSGKQFLLLTFTR